MIFSVVFPQNVEYSSGVSILQIDHRTAHISQKNRSSPKFNTTALGHSNDRQFDDVAIEESLVSYRGFLKVTMSARLDMSDAGRRDSRCGVKDVMRRSQGLLGRRNSQES